MTIWYFKKQPLTEENENEDEETELKLNMPRLMQIILITGAFILICFAALYLPGINVVFGFIGATSANLIGFILPGGFFLRAIILE